MYVCREREREIEREKDPFDEGAGGVDDGAVGTGGAQDRLEGGFPRATCHQQAIVLPLGLHLRSRG